MNRLKSILALSLLVISFAMTSCSQDDTMDDIMDNTEINSPAPNGDGSGDDGSTEDDDPTGN